MVFDNRPDAAAKSVSEMVRDATRARMIRTRACCGGGNKRHASAARRKQKRRTQRESRRKNRA